MSLNQTSGRGVPEGRKNRDMTDRKMVIRASLTYFLFST